MRKNLVTMLPHVVDGPLCIQKSEQIIKFVGALLVAIIIYTCIILYNIFLKGF